MKEFHRFLAAHKAFVAIIAVILSVSLVRIPLGTFNDNSSIDSLSHFLLPALMAPLLYALSRQLLQLPRMRMAYVVTLVTLLGISGAVIWEVFEFGVDAWFGTRWQVDNADTMHDLMLAVIGSPLGGWLYVKIYGLQNRQTARQPSSPTV